MWIRFLHAHFGLRHFFMEFGHSFDLLANKYLQTRDSSWVYIPDNTFWPSLYDYNAALPDNEKINVWGVGMDDPKSYFKAMKLILPATEPPEEIRPYTELVKNAKDTTRGCGYMLGINAELKKALFEHKDAFRQYYGAHYSDLERIVMNPGKCGDRFRNRNGHMASNFLSFDKQFNEPVYYGELGEAHTILKNKNTAYIINHAPAFRDKVCVINTCCYRCTRPEEKVSNWPLQGIEKNILAYFLPYCTSGFTLFDLTGHTILIKKYQAYSQFLIVAMDQH